MEFSSEVYGSFELDQVQRAVSDATGKSVTLDGWPFRKGTAIRKIRNAFILSGAGMGDFICYMPAILWVAKNCPWIEGYLFCREYFVEFARTVMAQNGFDWEVHPVEKMKQLMPKNVIVVGPGIELNGKVMHQLFNGCGAHLVDVGFAYFANRLPLSDDEREYPQLEGLKRPHASSTHVVFATGGLSPNRTVPGHYWNPIIDWVLKKCMTPVFLGKSEMSPTMKANFPDGCDYHCGIDLRDKTTMLEAAAIMKYARAVIGFDSGLLHLAGCTDANIVAGFGSVEPRERKPYRPAGKWTALRAENLPCIGCQTNMKMMFPHNFRNCLYKRQGPNGPEQDTLCIDWLFKDGARAWIEALENVLN